MNNKLTLNNIEQIFLENLTIKWITTQATDQVDSQTTFIINLSKCIARAFFIDVFISQVCGCH